MFGDLRLDTLEHPSRYVGGEIGSVRKDPAEALVHMALAFPDLYEIGMSSTGFHVLYAIANAQSGALCERVFTPAKDMLEELRRARTPLYGLETKTPLREMDLVLFSIQYELACTNVLVTLDAAGIPRRAERRTDHDPIVIAGGHCASNPEPWAPFFDALVVGDGEEVVVEILRCVQDHRRAPRCERLEALGRIEGVYLPQNWRPRYADGRFDGFDIVPGVEPTRRRIVMNLDAVPVPTAPPLPHTRLVHDRLAVEVMRGCTRGCRFCQPGMLTRPMRERSVKSVVEIIDEGLAQTGYDEVTLLSLSSGDYTQLMPLLGELTDRHNQRHISISLPSLRAEAVHAGVFEKIGAVRKSGFTIAPEAGTQRLRNVLNKPITDEQIFDACRAVNAQGWALAKLYFMVGLPTETDDDLDGIVDLCFRVLSIMRGNGQNNRAQVNVNVGAFVPKPFTPFAWEPQLHFREAERRLRRLREKIARSAVRLKGHDPRMSFIEGLVGRGDRRMADAIEWVVDHGGGFDGWTEHFNIDRWLAAFDATGVEVDRLLAGYGVEDPLPWDGVDALIEKKFLLKERRAAYEQAFTDDCRWSKCTACGSCDFEGVKNQLAPEYVSVPAPDENPLSAFGTPLSSDGRGAGGEGLPPPPTAPQYRYRVRFGKIGPMRHLGHLEMAPILHRAMRRAKLNLAYTQGFNPTPRVAFGPPLGSGVESQDEYMDIYLRSFAEPEEIHRRLVDSGVDGLPILDVQSVGLGEDALFATIAAVEFRADLAPLLDAGSLIPDAVGEAARRFSDAEAWPVEIHRKNKTRRFDAREVIENPAFVDGRYLVFRLRYRPEGSIKPVQAAASLLSLPEDAFRTLRWTKTKTYFNPDSSTHHA